MNSKKIILVADDEQDLLDLDVIALSSKGFEVLQAKNGKEVMEWLERKGNEISLLLLDIVMPEMDGFEVLEKIKNNEDYKKIPVIVSSNLDSEADRQSAFALGAKDYFEKIKFNPGQLADKISNMLAGK